jgi:TolB-like protein
MKNHILPLFIVLCSLFIVTCGSTPQATTTTAPDELDMAIRDASDYLNDNIPAGSKIVILNIQSNSEALSEYIIDELIANAVNDRLFEVVDRQQLDIIREEQNFQWAGEVDDNSALEIGRFFGAQIIVSGRVSQIADRYRFTVRALEVQTARVVGQNNINIAAGRTITALMRSQATATASGQSSGGQRTQTASGGAAQTAPAQTTPTTPTAPTAQTAAPTAIPNGTYTFFPRPRAMQAGRDIEAYIDKIVVRSGYFVIYLCGRPIGGENTEPQGGNYWYASGTRMTLQDLDNPRLAYNPVNVTYEEPRAASFQNVTGRRFSLTNSYNSVHQVFEEINLADAE